MHGTRYHGRRKPRWAALATATLAVFGCGARTELRVPRAFVEVAAGMGHTCARTETGLVLCWGLNRFGELGDGTTTPRATAALVPALRDATQLALAGHRTCVRATDGATRCWGLNQFGQAGTATLASSAVPQRIDSLSGARDLAATTSVACAVVAGQLACAGSWSDFPIGDPPPAAAHVVGPFTNLLDAALGPDHTCVRDASRAVRCWSGDLDPMHVPLPVTGVTAAVQVAAGSGASCALADDGTVACWGANVFGQLGDGTRDDRDVAAPVVGLSRVVQVAMGRGHACALTHDGAVWCWGDNQRGQLGDGTTTVRTTPTRVSGLPPVGTIGLGEYHSCAVVQGQQVWCWGDNADGQLGDGTHDDRVLPARSTAALPSG